MWRLRDGHGFTWLRPRHEGDPQKATGSHIRGSDKNEPDHPDPRFLGFLTRVVRDWGTTFRLAFLIGVVVASGATVLLFVRLSDQWIWVVLGSLGVHLTAKLRRRVKPDGED